jgi:hypothetical protein
LLHCHDTRKYASSETLKALDVDIEVPTTDTVASQVETADLVENCDTPVLFNGVVNHHDEECCQRQVLRGTDHEIFETSSDTLTGDDGHIIAADTELSGNEFGCCRTSLVATSNGGTAVQNNHSTSTNGLSCHCANSLGSLKTADRCSSTSDISSSQIVLSNDLSTAESKWQGQGTGPLSVDTAALPISVGRNGFVIGTDTDGSLSQTPSRSSTSPPTPSGDLKVKFINVVAVLIYFLLCASSLVCILLLVGPYIEGLCSISGPCFLRLAGVVVISVPVEPLVWQQ